MQKELKRILIEDMDEDVLKRMPEWFRILREAYLDNLRKSILNIK